MMRNMIFGNFNLSVLFFSSLSLDSAVSSLVAPVLFRICYYLVSVFFLGGFKHLHSQMFNILAYYGSRLEVKVFILLVKILFCVRIRSFVVEYLMY